MRDCSRLLAEWKEAARRLREEFGLQADFDRHVQARFRRTILRSYWEPVYQQAMRACDMSDEKLAAKLDIARTTVYRWRGDLVADKSVDGDPKADGASKQPSLYHFLLIMATFRIGVHQFQDGLAVVLEAYRQAVNLIDEALHSQPQSRPIHNDEILCLHFACRNAAWREAQLNHDTMLLTEAGRDICGRIGRLLPETSITTVDDICATIDRHIKVWLVLETVILHECFE